LIVHNHISNNKDTITMSKEFTTREDLKREADAYCANPDSYDDSVYGAIEEWNVSRLKSMSQMFFKQPLCNPNVSQWDVSKVTDFTDMFKNANKFNQNISGWNVSSATGFNQMFQNAFEFNQNVGDWDVSNANTFSGMFDTARSFNQDIGDWDVATSTSFVYMFYEAIEFDQNIGRWDVSTGNNFGSMFHRATKFNQNLSEWNVSPYALIDGMFFGATSFNQDLSLWKVDERNADNFCTNGATCFKSPPNSSENVLEGLTAVKSNCCTYPSFCALVATNGNLQDNALGGNCGNAQDLIYDLGVSKSVSTLTYVYCKTPGFSNGSVKDFALYSGDSVDGPWTPVLQGELIEDINKNMVGERRVMSLDGGSHTSRYWKWSAKSNHGNNNYIWTCEIELRLQSNISSRIPLAFTTREDLKREADAYCTNPDSYDDSQYGAIEEWNVSKLKSMYQMFFNQRTCNPNISQWDVSSVTDFTDMFREAYMFNQNISGWNVSSATGFNQIFNDAYEFNQSIGEWDVSKANTFIGMFDAARSFNQYIGDWNVATSTSFAEMFWDASEFNQNLSEWNVSPNAVIDGMFYGARSFNQDLSLWKVDAQNADKFCTNGATCFNVAPFNAPPTRLPSPTPSRLRSNIPSRIPSQTPSRLSSQTPSILSSQTPSRIPSHTPSRIPSNTPSVMPSNSPSSLPSNKVSSVPTINGSPSTTNNNSYLYLIFIPAVVIIVMCTVIYYKVILVKKQNNDTNTMTDDYKDDPNNEQQTKITGARGAGGVVVSDFQNNPLPQYSSTNLSYASSTNLVSDFENKPLPSSTNLSIDEIPEATCVTLITSSSYVSKSDPVLSYTTAPTAPPLPLPSTAIIPFTASTALRKTALTPTTSLASVTTTTPTASLQDLSKREKHIFLSARFDGKIRERIARSLHAELLNISVNSFMCSADAGENFGEHTSKGLSKMEAMICVCYDDYGERTESTWCTYYELKYAYENRIPIIPLKFTESWPPVASHEESGECNNKVIFAKDLIYLDWYDKDWNAEECAMQVKENIVSLIEKKIL